MIFYRTNFGTASLEQWFSLEETAIHVFWINNCCCWFKQLTADLKSDNGIKTTISQWTLKEYIARIYKYLLHNGILHFMLIWSCVGRWLFSKQKCFTKHHNEHSSWLKGNIQTHAGMIHIRNGKCLRQTVNDLWIFTFDLSSNFLYIYCIILTEKNFV